jgi:hypothetical protein
MTKHTPGPWGFGNTDEDKKLILGDNGKGNYVCSIQIYQTPRRMGLWQEEERLANARLIASAPELLEALKNLYNETSGKVRPDILRVLREKTKQIIAKAEGIQ